MLLSKVLNIVVQKCLVVAELLPDWEDVDLVDSGLGTHRFQRKQQLFTDVDNFAGERSPFRLTLDESALGILLFLLKHHIVLLEQHEFLFQVIHLHVVQHSIVPLVSQTDCLLLFKVSIPVKK